MDSLSSGSSKSKIASLQNFILNGISSDGIENVQSNSLMEEIENISVFHPWFIKEHLIYALRTFAEGLSCIDIDFMQSQKQLQGSKIGFWYRPLSPVEGLPHFLAALQRGANCEIITDRYNRRLLEFFFRVFKSYLSIPEERYSFQESSFSRDASAIVVIGEKPLPVQLGYISKHPIFLETAERFGNELIITGSETQQNLDMMAIELGMYFGRSIYNKSVLRVPENYKFEKLTEALKKFEHYSNHSRYFNHYEYRKAGFIVGRKAFTDTGTFLLTPAADTVRYISVIQYFVSKDEIFESDIADVELSNADSFEMRMFKSLPEFCKFISTLSNRLLLF